MGRALIIIILGMMGTLGILQISMNDRSNTSVESAVDNYYQQYARNMAHSEINRFIDYLSKNPSFRSSNKLVNNVFEGYTVTTVTDTVINSNLRVLISALGYYGGETVDVRVVVKLPEAADVPEFLTDLALASGGNYKMSNGVIQNCCDAGKNANVHTNGDFDQSNGTIYGFVSHSGSYSDKNVLPPDNPYGLPVHSQVSPISIPAWQLSDFAGTITDSYYSDLKINGTFNLGTLANPKVIYVDGKLELGSKAEISGYGIFVVEGEVKGSGGATINEMDPNKINVAIYCTDKMSFSNGSYANLLLYTNSEFKISNGHIYGSAVAVGKAEMSNGGIYHKALSDNLVPNTWKSGSSRSQILAWYE